MRTWQKIPVRFGVTWVGGPRAIEIARLIEPLADDDQVADVLRPGDEGEESYARLRVRGYSAVVLEADLAVGLSGPGLAWGRRRSSGGRRSSREISGGYEDQQAPDLQIAQQLPILRLTLGDPRPHRRGKIREYVSL